MNLWLVAVQMNLLENVMMKKHFMNAYLILANWYTECIKITIIRCTCGHCVVMESSIVARKFKKVQEDSSASCITGFLRSMLECLGTANGVF